MKNNYYILTVIFTLMALFVGLHLGLINNKYCINNTHYKIYKSEPIELRYKYGTINELANSGCVIIECTKVGSDYCECISW